MKATPDKTSVRPTLWNRQMIFLFGATFLAYSNISVFFHFYAYMGTLGIDPRWFGLLISIFSAVSLAVRPVISPFFHTENARPFLLYGTAMVIAALISYSLAHGLWSLILVRVFHSLAFVILGTALMALTVLHIPKERSAQAFGLLAIIILIPNTIIPPALPFLSRHLGGFTHVLLLFAGITFLVFPFIMGIRPPQELSRGDPPARSLTLGEIREDLTSASLIMVLGAMLFLYSGYALVFFFLDGYGRSIGITDTGLFLTLATLGEIGVRLGAGSRFDRMHKPPLITLSMLGLTLAYAALAHVPGRTAFFGLGLLLGLGWGVAMPVFNGLLFDMSPPRVRVFNINLGMQMFQGGFFLGPFLGGPILVRYGFPSIFHMCAVLSIMSAGLIFMMERKNRNTP